MDIVDQIVALGARDTLVLPIAEVAEAFGAGETGIAVLQEIAEDSNCAVHVDPDQVAIVGH